MLWVIMHGNCELAMSEVSDRLLYLLSEERCMRAKKKRQLERRLSSLPKHYPDNDVLIEALTDTKLGNQCGEYLNRLGYKYRGFLSLSVLGEYNLIVFRDSKTDEDVDYALRFLYDMIKRKKIAFGCPKVSTYEIIGRMRQVETRLESLDALHLATAVDNGANVFVTFDKTLMNSKRLEKEFHTRIMHPRDL